VRVRGFVRATTDSIHPLPDARSVTPCTNLRPKMAPRARFLQRVAVIWAEGG